jgi:hypothetical protein
VKKGRNGETSDREKYRNVMSWHGMTSHHTTPHHTTPHFTTLHFSTPHHTTPHYTTLQHTTAVLVPIDPSIPSRLSVLK